MGFREEARENRLKKRVEESIRSQMKERALKECEHYLALYAECARGRTVSLAWHCRGQIKELNECLHQYTNDEAFEEYKRKYLMEKEGKISQ